MQNYVDNGSGFDYFRGETKNDMKTLPTTLTEIRNAAASMFADKAVISVNITASFGMVTVYRNGDIFAA